MLYLLPVCFEQDGSSVVEETPSSEQMVSRIALKVGPHQQQKQQQHYHKTPAISSPYSHCKRKRVKKLVGQQQRLQDHVQLVHSGCFHSELEFMVLLTDRESTELLWLTEATLAHSLSTVLSMLKHYWFIEKSAAWLLAV